jgi:hypothetical protein
VAIAAPSSASGLPIAPILKALPIPLPPVPLLLPTAAPTSAAPEPAADPGTPAPNAPSTPTVPSDPVGALQQAVLPNCGAGGQPFGQFGDQNTYFPFPNNGFEGGSTGWVLNRSSVGRGNEPWFVNGPGSSSLTVPPHGAAGSPLVCIGLLDPFWRMFARAAGANGPLHVQVVFYGATGNLTGLVNFDDLPAARYASWSPTTRIRSLLALPALTKYAQLRVASGASRGNWQIDDVFVDPWANRG